MNKYASLPFKVNGIGSFYDRDGRQVVATYADGEYTDISVTDGVNGGYVRTNGAATLTAGDKLTCDSYYYKATQELHLVVGVMGYDLFNVQTKCMTLTQSIPDVRIRTVTGDKKQILTDEGIEKNQLEWFKIVFEYTYDYVTDENGCPIALCGSSGNTGSGDCIEFSGIVDTVITGNPVTLLDNVF